MSTSSPEPRRVVPPITRTARIALRMIFATLIGLSTMLAACSAIDSEVSSDTDGTWVGTITTEGNVTTVVNESGSVWGGTATLVEEASIGVEMGAPEYMLGSIGGLWATDDEIYVIDAQLPAVHVYDYGGQYLRDIGSPGQGPGEYVRPTGVYVDTEGRVYVHEVSGNARVNVYSAAGEHIDTWTSPDGSRLFSSPLIMSLEGAFYARVTIRPDPTDPSTLERVMQQVGPEGLIGDKIPRPVLEFDPLTISVEYPFGSTESPVPYSPGQISAFSPTVAWITGVNDAYHFEIHHAGGSITRVEKFWDPVPIQADEAAYSKQWMTDRLRRNASDFEWNGPPIPKFKPAYDLFNPTLGNRVLVVREGPSVRAENCDERDAERSTRSPCYEPQRVWDMFDLEGNFLGEVIRPPGRLSQPYFRGEAALLHVEDDAGTIMVKRYRLVLPGEVGQ